MTPSSIWIPSTLKVLFILHATLGFNHTRLTPKKKIFFSTKAYLPSETPAGLEELREMELRQLRGDGRGLRVASDRIYDYDTYNDIGDPDKGIEHSRPTLGGHNNPHPRRCRTGHPPTNTEE